MATCPICGYSTDKKQRSNNQNRYYHGVVLELLSAHTGYTKSEMHEILKSLFLKSLKTLATKTGPKEVEYTRSTTELNTSEFEKYMSEVREFASIELNCFIPDPNQELMEAT